ncbi:hypothetical protein NQ176_g3201 [Zarea fungicola]|uniref:Uncharacterized protein n=1 Tax=Zarea fungicola TaxID=93591 RepID=A0ACC1NMD0_9HYPO|nr:hypothetical protein NQ176_g3201 [Lecanicillium fungicola]
MAPMCELLWVNKNAQSASLSHSHDRERLQVFSQAQRTSRKGKRKAAGKDGNSETLQSRQKSSTRTLRKSSTYTIVPLQSSGSSHPADAGEGASSPRFDAENLILKPALAIDPSCTSMEARSIEFFVRVSMPKIMTTQRDFSFWSCTVPCLARCHPAFRHLVAAIASTHELLYSTDTAALNVFALTQCNRAIECLRSSPDWSPAQLLISCILVSAYNLLRCDLDRAELSIESGLEMAKQHAEKDQAQRGRGDETATLRRILAQLGRQHGFKLWAPGITFQFERSKAAENSIVIDTDCVRGPFIAPRQALEAYRSLMLKVVARLMRNLARGAFIDPACFMAQDITRQLSMFSFYWDLLYRDMSPQDEDGRLELKQIKIGFYQAFLMFHTKLVAPSELSFDEFPVVVNDLLQLAEEIVAAGANGRPTIYLDKIVNGALFSLGLCTCKPDYRKSVIELLQGQADYGDGLTNWVRGAVVDVFMKLDHISPSWWNGRGASAGIRMVLDGLRCSNHGNDLWIEFKSSDWTATRHSIAVPIDWSSWLGPRPAASEVDIRLQGIVSAYRIYGKPHILDAKNGYAVEMWHRGRRIPVAWEVASAASLRRSSFLAHKFCQQSTMMEIDL